MHEMPQVPYWLPPSIFLLSACLVALLAWPAERLGWVDHPSDRKHHRHPVPLVGGVAMWAAFCVGVVLLPSKPPDYWVLLVGMTLLTLVGLYDDLRHTRPAVRFLFQALAVILLGLAEQTRLVNLGDLFGLGPVVLGWAAWPLTIFAVIGVINAFNMIDGLDGLAGGLAIIVTGWLLLLCLGSSVIPVGRIGGLLMLAMAIAGFLVYNLRHRWRARASVFMGDAGSTMLGFVLSWFLIRMSQGEQVAMDPITAVWIMAIPLMDTLAVMLRRLIAGHNPFAADRQHLHHLLLDLRLSDGRAAALILAVACGFGGLGVLAQWLDVPQHLRFYAFVGVFLFYYVITTMAARRRRHPQSRDNDRRQPPHDIT